MSTRVNSLLMICLVSWLNGMGAAIAQGPLPNFKFQGVALHPKDLSYAPNNDLIHPAIVKTEGRIENPLGKFYLYFAPHKHIAISMAYSDSIAGPWKEYKGNPVVEGPSAPDVRWVEEHGKFFLWGHKKNSQTELWTSDDGIHFRYHSVSVTAKNIGTRNATYSRMYEYPLKLHGSKYIMLYSGFLEDREIRCIWLAHSKDAKSWVQLKTPLVEPSDGEMNDCYGPAMLRWKDRNFVVYQDHTTWRGGNIKYVEVDQELNSVGAGGERFVLLDPPAEPPLNDRYRGAEFYVENGKLYLYSSASRNPRLLVYATAELNSVSEPSGLGNDRREMKVRSDTIPGPHPGSRFDLNHWKLTLPTNSEHVYGGHPREISAKTLVAGFKDRHFYSDSSGAMVFWCPVVGSTTEGTRYPRSELREMLQPDDPDENWTSAGFHEMTARCRVLQIPSYPKIVIGQIHSYSGKSKPLVKLQYYKGRIEALVKLSPEKGADKKLTFADVDLNTDIDWTIRLNDGVLSIRVNGDAKTENMIRHDPSWEKQTFYFKAGVYPQDNEGDESEGARVSFSHLSVRHGKT